MPGKRKDNGKTNAAPVQKPKGVLEIIVPSAKNNKNETPAMFDFLKNNASYSELTDNPDEETKLIKLKIEERLNEILQVPQETKLLKTEKPITANVQNSKNSFKKSTETACITLFAKAVSQIEGVAKRPENREKMSGTVSRPKRDILFPLNKSKKNEEDYFVGTKVPKEKKLKPKKEQKLIHLNFQSAVSSPAPPTEIQPVIANRWQEKEGSKLFNNEPDEEDEMLKIAIAESLKLAKLEKEKRIQEQLLYEELTMEAKRAKLERRERRVREIVREENWDDAGTYDGCSNQFASRIDEIKNISVPEMGSSWDDEIDLVRKEIDERNAKKERVKKNLKEKLKLLDNYGPVVENEEETAIVKKSKEVVEKVKSVKNVGGEIISDLKFVDVSDDEEKKVKVSKNWQFPEKEIQWNAKKKPDILLEKKMESLTFNDANKNDEEIFKNFRKEKPKSTNNSTPKPSQDTFCNSTFDSDIRGLPPKSQRRISERKKSDSKSPEATENVLKKSSSVTVSQNIPKNADYESRGFSQQYQNRRREFVNKTEKSDPSSDLFSTKEIPKLNDFGNEKIEGPFEEIEENVPKELNNLSADINLPNENELWKHISSETVYKYLHQYLQQEQEKINLLSNFQNMPNIPSLNNLPLSDLSQLSALPQSACLNSFNNAELPNILNSLNMGNTSTLPQMNNLNLPNNGHSEFQVPNLQATGLNMPDIGDPRLQIPNLQQAIGLNLSNFSNLQEAIKNLNLTDLLSTLNPQQAEGLNLPDIESIQQIQSLNLQKVAEGLNLPDIESIQQIQSLNLQQAANRNLPPQGNNLYEENNLNLPNAATFLQQASNLNSTDLVSQECLATNDTLKNKVKKEVEDLNEIQKLTLKVMELERELKAKKEQELLEKKQQEEKKREEKEKEKRQMEEEKMQQEKEQEQQLEAEEAEMYEVPPEELPLEGGFMGPLMPNALAMMPNPYVSFHQPIFYPTMIPPPSHLPPPPSPWAAATPYMGPMVFRPPFHMPRPH